jgi:hypothetical protein
LDPSQNTTEDLVHKHPSLTGQHCTLSLSVTQQNWQQALFCLCHLCKSEKQYT